MIRLFCCGMSTRDLALFLTSDTNQPCVLTSLWFSYFLHKLRDWTVCYLWLFSFSETMGGCMHGVGMWLGVAHTGCNDKAKEKLWI